jgi:hypothetical protein
MRCNRSAHWRAFVEAIVVDLASASSAGSLSSKSNIVGSNEANQVAGDDAKCQSDEAQDDAKTLFTAKVRLNQVAAGDDAT